MGLNGKKVIYCILAKLIFSLWNKANEMLHVIEQSERNVAHTAKPRSLQVHHGFGCMEPHHEGPPKNLIRFFKYLYTRMGGFSV